MVRALVRSCSRRAFLGAVGVVTLSGCSRPPSVAGRWPMQGFDAANTGSNPAASGPGATRRVRWSYDTGQVVHGSPAVAAGRVFVPTYPPRLHAFDARTGDVSWQRPLPDAPFGNAGPVVVDETVVVGLYDGSVRAFDVRSGAVQWTTSLVASCGRTVIFSTPVLVGDTLYVTTAIDVEDGPHRTRLYALDPTTGAESERLRLPTSGYGRPAVADGTVYLALGPGAVRAVDLATGDPRWTFRSTDGKGGAAAPVVDEGTVFASLGRHLYALDAATGRERWRAPTGDYVVASSPAYSDGSVYVGGPDHRVHAYEATTGRERWQFEAGYDIVAKPVVAGGTVYAPCTDRRMYALDADTGERYWAHRTERLEDGWLFGAIHSSPAVVDDTIYFGSEDYKVYALTRAHS